MGDVLPEQRPLMREIQRIEQGRKFIQTGKVFFANAAQKNHIAFILGVEIVCVNPSR